MRIAGLKYNDIVDGIGICVSLWAQGCPFHCVGCHNPQTWDFDGGYIVNNLKDIIIKAINANKVNRNFSILGGEPLCPENIEMVKEIVLTVRTMYPDIKIFLWTGYTLKELKKRIKKNRELNCILNNIDYLIDGRFEEDKKDLTLWLRGSRNQNVYQNINGEFQIIAGDSDE